MEQETNLERILACHRILYKACQLFGEVKKKKPETCLNHRSFLRMVAVSIAQIDCKRLHKFLKKTVFKDGGRTFRRFLRLCRRIAAKNGPRERVGSMLACNLTSDATQSQLNSKHAFDAIGNTNMTRRQLYQMTETGHNAIFLKPGTHFGSVRNLSFRWRGEIYVKPDGTASQDVPDAWIEALSGRNCGAQVHFRTKKDMISFYKENSMYCHCIVGEKKNFLTKLGTTPVECNTFRSFYACAHNTAKRTEKDYLAENVIKFVYAGRNAKHLNRAGLGLEKESTFQKASFEAMTSVFCKRAYGPKSDEWETITPNDVAGTMLFGCGHASTAGEKD